jgi:hydrogenase maturation factor HypE
MKMSKSARILITSMLSAMLLPQAVISQESVQDAAPGKRDEMTLEERRAAWDGMSEEEKQAIRGRMQENRERKRAEWEALTPEEREAKRAEMRKKFDAMTPEQQEALKKRRRQAAQQGGKKRQKQGEEKEPAEL